MRELNGQPAQRLDRIAHIAGIFARRLHEGASR